MSAGRLDQPSGSEAASPPRELLGQGGLSPPPPPPPRHPHLLPPQTQVPAGPRAARSGLPPGKRSRHAWGIDCSVAAPAHMAPRPSKPPRWEPLCGLRGIDSA